MGAVVSKSSSGVVFSRVWLACAWIDVEVGSRQMVGTVGMVGIIQ